MNTMTNEEQNIAIAEILGWTHCKSILRKEKDWSVSDGPEYARIGSRPKGSGAGSCTFPNYTGCLNACASMIEFLEDQGLACIIIYERGHRCCTFTRNRIDVKVISDNLPRAICEAFLRVHNRWVE